MMSSTGGGYGAPHPPPPIPATTGMAAAPVGVPAFVPGGTGVLVGFLVTFQNEPAGKFWPLRSGQTTMGRQGAEEVADILLEDASASGRHATIIGDPSTGQAYVEDAGSRNGTYVNEIKLEKGVKRQLSDNDRLRLGSITMVVKLLASG